MPDHDIVSANAKPAPREAQRRERIGAILAAAQKIFTEGGPAQFSSRRVAAEAGVRLSLVQHYFGSHENLVLATVDSILGSYPQRYAELAKDTSKPARQRLEALLDDALEAVALPAVGQFTFQSFALGLQDDAVGRLIQDRYRKYVDVIADLMRQAVPGLKPSEANLRAIMMASHTEGLMIFYYRDGFELPAKEVRRSLRRFLDSLLEEA